MSTYILVSMLAVVGFGLGLWATGLVNNSKKAIKEAISGVSAMLDPDLNDASKEVAVRRAGLRLIASASRIFLSFFVAFAAAALPILSADMIGLASKENVINLMLRLDYIIAVTAISIAVSLLVQRRIGGQKIDKSPKAQYSIGDQSLHIIAFSNPSILKNASWLEDSVTRTSLQQMPDSPIFITSLARGGTTSFLNAIHSFPEVATHLYRDMPFLTAPMLWDRLAGGAKRSVARRERAHGDGLEIDLDSPEAFEEVIWKMFWPHKYQSGIDLWLPEVDRQADAEFFMHRHFGKIVQARRKQGRPEAERYCSKNNANIGRIPFLRTLFPEGKIIVVVREPTSHARSLLRQHKNFLTQHQENVFTQRYMRDIGHFEFGSLHKPILFPNFELGFYDALSSDYWLDYWSKAFDYVLKFKEECVFVFQDDLRSKSDETMHVVCEKVGLNCRTQDFSKFFHQRPEKIDLNGFSPKLVQDAEQIYAELKSTTYF